MLRKPVYLIITVFSIFSLHFCSALFSESTDEVITYGTAVVDKIIEVDDALSFRCDIKDWPAVIGKDIRVRIDGIELAGKDKDIAQSQKTIDLVKSVFADAEKISLANIKRGTSFCIIADVIADANSLADTLITQKLAQPATAPVTGTLIKKVDEKTENDQNQSYYVASKNSKIFHLPQCRFAKTISEKNMIKFDTKQDAENSNRRPCKTCSP